MLIFGLVIYGIVTVAENKPTLTVNNTGILDNSFLNSVGRVVGEDIDLVNKYFERNNKK